MSWKRTLPRSGMRALPAPTFLTTSWTSSGAWQRSELPKAPDHVDLVGTRTNIGVVLTHLLSIVWSYIVNSGLVHTGPGPQPGYEEVQKKLVALWPQYVSKYSDYSVKVTGLDFLVRAVGTRGSGGLARLGASRSGRLSPVSVRQAKEVKLSGYFHIFKHFTYVSKRQFHRMSR